MDTNLIKRDDNQNDLQFKSKGSRKILPLRKLSLKSALSIFVMEKKGSGLEFMDIEIVVLVALNCQNLWQLI
jgi:hypothetical protein